jgi:hypothetical protein
MHARLANTMTSTTLLTSLHTLALHVSSAISQNTVQSASVHKPQAHVLICAAKQQVIEVEAT